MEHKRGSATIVAFKCTECNKIIGLGKCVDHRQHTHHKTFDAIYEESKIQIVAPAA